MATHAAAELPALESGMCLTAEEFDRRYELRPDIKKAELVQGVVYVASPTRIYEHAVPDGILGAWLMGYSITHAGTVAASNGTVHLSPFDRVQPDSMLWKTSASTAVLGTDHYLHGAPELAAEVAASSASYDLHSKKESYLQAGVSEYVVWVTESPRIYWFVRVGNTFEELAPGADGWTESRVFPGLRLHVARLLAGDRSVVLPGAA